MRYEIRIIPQREESIFFERLAILQENAALLVRGRALN